jgi:nitroreductase
MKRQLTILALMLLMGGGATVAQDCCKQKGEGEKKECTGGQKKCAGEKKECAGGQKSCCQQKNATLEAIMTRTSIRKFTDEPVKPCMVEKLLRAAMAAPTAVNKQPWHFVVVDQKEVLDKLAGEGRRGDMLRNALLAIVVCGNLEKALDGDAEEFWVQDASAATENLLLAAHSMGLGAVWTGMYPTPRAALVQQMLDLPENIEGKESALESAVISNLQKFLLELGKGFSFVARQFRISTETDHFYADLVFYNYLLKCFVVIDLKTTKLSHADIGQMDMYVRMFDELKRGVDDNPTIGIILCTDKSETMVKYSVLQESQQIFASKYKAVLPTEEELADMIQKENTLLLASED